MLRIQWMFHTESIVELSWDVVRWIDLSIVMQKRQCDYSCHFHNTLFLYRYAQLQAHSLDDADAMQCVYVTQ